MRGGTFSNGETTQKFLSLGYLDTETPKEIDGWYSSDWTIRDAFFLVQSAIENVTTLFWKHFELDQQ